MQQDAPNSNIPVALLPQQPKHVYACAGNQSALAFVYRGYRKASTLALLCNVPNAQKTCFLSALRNRPAASACTREGGPVRRQPDQVRSLQQFKGHGHHVLPDRRPWSAPHQLAEL